MNISEACVIIERQAKLEGTGILEVLQNIDSYGIHDYISCYGLSDDFRLAYNVFMFNARQMFAKVEA